MGRGVPQIGGSLADVGKGMAHVARAEVAIDRSCLLQMGVDQQQILAQLLIQLIQRCALADGNVVDLIDSFLIFSGSCQQIDLSHVLDEAEVATGFSIAIYVDGLAFDHARNPLGDDGSIRTIGILTRAKDVEVAKADGAEAIGAGEHIGIEFVDILCYRIW